MRVYMALGWQYLREHRLATLVWLAVTALMSYVVASTAPAVADEQLLRAFLRNLPSQVRSLFGDYLQYRNGVDYYLSYKWLQIVPLLAGIFGALEAVAVIARDIDRRTADFTLALPVRRSTVLLARFAAVAVNLALFYLVTLVALWAELWQLGLPGSVARYGALFAGQYFVSLAFASLAVLLSLVSRSYGAAVRASELVVIAAYVADLANRVAGGPTALSRIVLFGWVGTREVVGEGSFPWGAMLLGLALSAILLRLSVRVLQRKQIPA
ncbi:MAG: ABC transporter permease [Firmicutes bacterium]|nr:ABC transporter permease [Bacillota bacterium]